jgi:cysteine desulfurase/selenocysteine lyase
VAAWNADFIVFSGHKMLGPSGIGVLYGKRQLLEAMPPFLGGGSMIRTVTTAGFSPGELPAKFEAGTPPIVEAIGLGAAIRYLKQFAWTDLLAYDHLLTQVALDGLAEISGVELLGAKSLERSGIVTFHVPGVSAQDLAVLLDRQGIAVRAGHHCAMPLHDRLQIPASVRASFSFYNTVAEVELWLSQMHKLIAKLR